MKNFDPTEYIKPNVDQKIAPNTEEITHVNNQDQTWNYKYELIQHCIAQLEYTGIDITTNYDDWLKTGFAFASLGENGRNFYHKVSALYPHYDYSEVDKKFSSLLRKYTGDIDIGTFFHFCKLQGISINLPKPEDANLGHDQKRKKNVNNIEIVKFTGKELLQRAIDKMPTLVDPIIPIKGLICLAGSSDIGKSSLLRQLALFVVNGKERFIGFNIYTRHRRAIYVSTEDDDLSISYLIRKQVNGLKDDYNNYEGLSYIFEYGNNLVQTLDQELSKQPVDLICIDAFSDLFQGQMNQANAVRSFLNEFSQLANRHDCLIIFLHHTGKKTEENEPSKHNLLGSQGFEAKLRLVIELRQDWYDPELRHLCIVKGNYLAKEYKTHSIVLRFDDNMLFWNTGKRVPFEELAKPDKKEEANEMKEEKLDQIMELKKQGNSLRKIEKITGIPKSTVERLIKDYESNKMSHELQPEMNLELSRPRELY